MKVLIVDDEQPRHNGFIKVLNGRHDLTHVYNCPEAISALTTQSFDVAFLDHDLHDLEDGRDLCAWFIKNYTKCPEKIFIHSWNAYCAHEMYDMLSTIPTVICLMQQPFCAYAEEPPDPWFAPHLASEVYIAEKSIKNFTKVVRAFIES